MSVEEPLRSQLLASLSQPLLILENDSFSDLSSDLSSIASLSPPPVDYPSPISSQEYDSSLPTTQKPSHKRPREDDELLPTKKRRTVEPKPRATVHLDLQSYPNYLATNQSLGLDILLKVLRKRRKIVVIAGAGISVSAGIPDFRSSNGLFTTLRSEHKLKASGKHLFDASVYQTDSSTSSFHDMVRSLSGLVNAAKPTAFHQMLATLSSQGRLMRLYTQNVDGIDTSLQPLETSVPLSTKGPWPRTIQLHGGLKKMVCSKCNTLSNFEAALFDGPQPPLCNVCVETDKVRTDHAGKRSHGIGKLRPRIVLYNEHNPDEEAIGAVVSSDLRARPDAVIVVGTSMKIPGVRRIVREMCGVVRGRKDGLTVWINNELPPVGKEFEDCWDLTVRGACDEVARHAGLRRWNDDGVDHKECTESEVESAKKRGGEVQVIIETPRKEPISQGIPTPGASPALKPMKIPKPKLYLRPPHPEKSTERKDNQKGKDVAKSKTLKTGSKTPIGSKGIKRTAGKVSEILGSAKISRSFKVTKPGLVATGKTKLRCLPLGQDDLPVPMSPIPPQAARNNGPVQNPAKLIFPNLPKALNFDNAPQELSQVKRRNSETISPTGTIPANMKMLLN